MSLKKSKIKNGIKNADSNYAMVVYLDYVNTYPDLRAQREPGYFRDELSIGDLRSYTRKMSKAGYIVKEEDGKFKITSRGERLLRKYDDYIKFFNCAIPYLKIEDYEKAKESSKEDISFEGIMISLMLKKIEELSPDEDFQQIGNLHFEIGTLYANLEYKGQAMYHYLVSLYYEVSGLEYYEKFLDYINRKCERKELEARFDGVYISPHLASAIVELGEVYYEDMSNTVFKKNILSINLCSKEKFKQLVMNIIDNEFDYNKWRGMFYIAYKDLLATADKKRKNG